MVNSFGVKSILIVGSIDYEIFCIDMVFGFEKFFFSFKVFLENLFCIEDGVNVMKVQIEVFGFWDVVVEFNIEIQFMLVCVVMQDFMGVLCIVDFVIMCEVVMVFGGDVNKINLFLFVEMVIDYFVIVDLFGFENVFECNVEIEYECNGECYQFLCWGQIVFQDFKVVLFGIGIVYQVNIEYLVKVIYDCINGGVFQVYFDICVGIDLYIMMVNGFGVLGWGVGGIEVEVVMFGQFVFMLILCVVGFKLLGDIFVGVIVIDVVFIIIDMLCKYGVVGKFVEFYGEGVVFVLFVNCVMIGNMLLEFGLIVVIFLIDDVIFEYLCFIGCSEEVVVFVEVYVKEQKFWYDVLYEFVFSEYFEFDFGMVVLLIVGLKCLQDCIFFFEVKMQFEQDILNYVIFLMSEDIVDFELKYLFLVFDFGQVFGEEELIMCFVYISSGVLSNVFNLVLVMIFEGEKYIFDNGVVIFVVIILCINMLNLLVMIVVGFVVWKVFQKGLKQKLWVKIMFGFGLKVVIDYYEKFGFDKDFEGFGFYMVGYGCIICIGNFGLLIEEVFEVINLYDFVVMVVFLGNCNFEGCISFDVKMNYLVSLLLVIVYVLVGLMYFDFEIDVLGKDVDGNDVFFKDIWLLLEEVQEIVDLLILCDQFIKQYVIVFDGDECWCNLLMLDDDMFQWDENLIYVCKVLYFDGMIMEFILVKDIEGVCVMVMFGDLVIIDYILLVGNIKFGMFVVQYFIEYGVDCKDFNFFGLCCGNYEVMICGMFVNICLKNFMVFVVNDGQVVEGGYICDFIQLDGLQLYIYDVCMNYVEQGILFVVFGGKEYGFGFFCDWVVKGMSFLGVKVVIMESFECIYCLNFIGMGVVFLQFFVGESWELLGFDGIEIVLIMGFEEFNNGVILKIVKVIVILSEYLFEGKQLIEFDVVVCIDIFGEVDYYCNGGILQYVLCLLV